MKKILLFLFFTTFAFAQKDGFWDKERAFTKEVKLSSGNRTLVKVDDLPEGASEFVYRISLIDENGKITTSLASILKSIPDPTGVSQGAAGALILGNSFSGDDTCVYGIFTSEKAGNQFLKDGKLEAACHFISEPVSKDSKVISIKNTKCFDHAPNIWFAFENKNWVMSTKIVLEVVSWVDYNASRGWNATTKKELLAEAEKLSTVKMVSNKSNYLATFLKVFAAKYKYSEYKQLLAIEKTNVFQSIAMDCLVPAGELSTYLDAIRSQAMAQFKKGKTEEALALVQKEIVDKKYATDKDYSILGAIYLYSKQFVKAEANYKKALEKNPSELLYQLNLAHVYMFTDQLAASKDIHKLYKDNNVSAQKSWIDQTKSDFEAFEKKGFSTDNFKKILRILE